MRKKITAGTSGALITLTTLVTGFGVRDAGRPGGPNPTLRHFLSGLRRTLANRAFSAIFATFCLMTVATSLGQAVQLLVIKYWLNLYDFFPAIALVFGLCFVGSFPLWMRLSHRIGKRRAFMVGLGLGCVVPFGWLLVPPGHRAAMLVFMVAAGIASGSVTLAMSQAIDVVDLDELHTGEQRAGAYFGVWTLGLKSMNALGILLGGVLLEAVGYVPEVTQDPRTLWWLIMLVGPTQAGVHAVGLLMFRRLRFDAGDVHRIQAELQARRGGASP